jgi:hypothetical protein
MSIRRLAFTGLLLLALPAGSRLAFGEGGPPQPPRQPPPQPPAGVPPTPVPPQLPPGQPPAGQPPAGQPPAGTPATAPGASSAMATRLFDEAVQWVARGQAGIQKVRDFYVALDAYFNLEGTKSEGPMRLWLQTPDQYRQEMTISNQVQTQILNKDRLWKSGPDRRFMDMNRMADAEEALKSSREDLERLVDITDFLTLQGLKGPGVTFESEGEKNPSGVFTHPNGKTWWKIVRKAPGRPDISFWLDHYKDAAGNVHATFPGIVRVAGDAPAGIADEEYILRDWEDKPTDPKRAFRYPRTIRALQARGAQRTEFLRAVVTDIKINEGIDPSRFLPDGARPPAPAPGAPAPAPGAPAGPGARR